MSGGSAAKRYQVRSLEGIDGPVGMDVGIWLRFDTDEGDVRLKLSHEDALALKQALHREHSIQIEPRRLVSETADALLHLAGQMAEQKGPAAEQLKGYANDLRLASEHMPEDD